MSNAVFPGEPRQCVVSTKKERPREAVFPGVALILVIRASCAWLESGGDSRIGEILIQPLGGRKRRALGFAIGDEAHAGEAKDHHGPGRRLGCVERRRRRLGIDENVNAIATGIRRVSVSAQLRKGGQRAIFGSRKRDLEHIADVCGDCLAEFVIGLDRPVEPAIAAANAAAALNGTRSLRAERILECPADRVLRPNGT